MSLADRIRHHLSHGPATNKEIALALDESPSRVAASTQALVKRGECISESGGRNGPYRAESTFSLVADGQPDPREMAVHMALNDLHRAWSGAAVA